MRRIHGVVVLGEHMPAAEARVALLEREGDRPVGEARVETVCNSRGAFVLAVPEGSGDSVVVAFLGGHLPWTRFLDLRATTDVDLGRIELSEGASISGHVLVSGDALTGGRVVATFRHAAERFHLRGGTLVWITDRFAWDHADAVTDRAGAYRIRGLLPDLYDVRMSSTQDAEPIFGIGDLGVREARAPAEGVDFDLPVSTLRVRFEYELLAEKRGVFGSIRIAVKVADGSLEHEETVELEPWPLATVSIDVGSASIQPVGRARFLFEPIEKSSRARAFTRLVPDRVAQQEKHRRGRSARSQVDANGQLIPEDVHVALSPRRDRFDLLHVPSGRYRVVVQLGEALSNDVVDDPAHLMEYCDAEVLVEVPEAGLIRAATEATRRPGVIVVARSQEGAQLPASCRLRDATGGTLEPFLIVENERGWWRSERLDSKLPTQVYSKLCAGTCALELAHEGYRSRTIPVLLVAGQSSVVEIVLERE